MNGILLLALSWVTHNWSGYQPPAKIEVVREGGREVRSITDVKGSHGACVYTVPRAVSRAGDVVYAVFEAKGSGTGFATVARYTEKTVFNQTSKRRKFKLTPEWKRYEFSFSVGDGTAGKTAKIDFQLGVEKGGEMYFADAGYEIDRRVVEDFEGPGPLAGGAQPITGNIAPGLLAQTGMGVITASGPRRIELPETSFSLPIRGNNAFFESAVRIYSFGRDERKDATLDMRFADAAGGGFAVRINHVAGNETLKCTLADKKTGGLEALGVLEVPYKVLPADFVFSASATGEVKLEVKSLADSSYDVRKGRSEFFKGRKDVFSTFMVYTPRAGSGELVIDEYSAGRAGTEADVPPVVFSLERAKEFDPVKAGWPLVFADEFDGTKVDTEKWDCTRNPHLAKVKDGLLHIRADWNKKGDKLETSALYSREAWTYGYFESRLRFTKNSGWWAAFWLCTGSCGNPFKDGFEIDIFEDYYTRCDKPGGVHKPILDHNLHMFGSGVLKSWNYRSTLPGSLDDFYVLGCKWTPFEISYYLDGKLISSKANHSPYGSVTFDAVSHGAGFSPLKAIVSGQIMSKSWFCNDPTGFSFPEDFLVDYVRVYALPDRTGPSVSIESDAGDGFYALGDKIRFDVKTAKAADGAAIRAVYLFDSGYLLDYKTQPPYVFDVSIDDGYYGSTRYMRPGRSGKLTPLKGTGIHVFAAYALDVKGRYAHSPENIEIVVGDVGKSTPYGGTAQKIPGVIKCGLFDEGGLGVAYSDNTERNLASSSFRTNEWVDAANETCIGTTAPGEWLTYSVDIAESGDYRAVFRYGTPLKDKSGLVLFLDGERIGRFDCRAHEAKHWGCDTDSVIESLHLPAGRHRLTILLEGKYNFSTIEFTRTTTKREGK